VQSVVMIQDKLKRNTRVSKQSRRSAATTTQMNKCQMANSSLCYVIFVMRWGERLASGHLVWWTKKLDKSMYKLWCAFFALFQLFCLIAYCIYCIVPCWMSIQWIQIYKKSKKYTENFLRIRIQPKNKKSVSANAVGWRMSLVLCSRLQQLIA